MTCNKSTMLKAAMALGILSLALYAALPGFRALITSVSPILLSLLCPLSMVFCMRHGMRQAETPEQGCKSNTAHPPKPNV